MFPKAVLLGIEKICRAYLWNGSCHHMKPGSICWDDVCKPKKACELGIKDINICNVANMGRHIWALATKQDNLWIEWISSLYLKHQDW